MQSSYVTMQTRPRMNLKHKNKSEKRRARNRRKKEKKASSSSVKEDAGSTRASDNITHEEDEGESLPGTMSDDELKFALFMKHCKEPPGDANDTPIWSPKLDFQERPPEGDTDN